MNKENESTFIDGLLNKREQLLEQIKALDKTLETFGYEASDTKNVRLFSNNMVNGGNMDIAKQLKGTTDMGKILYTLKINKRFMRIREIAEYVDQIIGGNADRWTVKFSRKTRLLQTQNKIASVKVGKSTLNTFWGSPNWLDSEGNIISEYKFSESALTESFGRKKAELPQIDL